MLATTKCVSVWLVSFFRSYLMQDVIKEQKQCRLWSRIKWFILSTRLPTAFSCKLCVTFWYLENCHILQSPLQYSNHMRNVYFYIYIFLLSPPYMFQCVMHHPQGKFSILAQNCQLFTRLLHRVYYNV